MTKFKECSVTMLPTQVEPEYKVGFFKDILSLNNSKYDKSLILFRSIDGIEIPNPQHLYVISDDKIKIGYWYVINWGGIQSLQQCTSEKELISLEDRRDCKKIIATTNISLQSKCDGKCAKYECVCLLPQPSDSFIQKYIDSYNQNNVITDVLVEYNEPELSGCLNYQEGICKEPCDNAGWCPDNRNKISLKINDKFNTITIKEIKNNYNKEEVIELCKESWQVGFNVGYNEENSPSYVTANDWITKNL